MSDLIDREAVEQAKALYTNEPPSDAAYKDETPITVTMTVGQAFSVRTALRAAAADYLGNVELVDQFGIEPTREQAEDTNGALRHLVQVDAALEALAPAANFRRTDEEMAELGLTREPAAA